MQINVTIDEQMVKEGFRKIMERTQNLTPAMRVIGQILRTSAIKNFEQGGRPRHWAKTQKKEGKTLVKSGRLMKSILPKAGPSQVQVGTNLVYAAIHQLGGKTSAHTIKARHKKFLFWPGAKHPVKEVSHPGSNIPARPYLMVQDEDWREISRSLFKRILEG